MNSPTSTPPACYDAEVQLYMDKEDPEGVPIQNQMHEEEQGQLEGKRNFTSQNRWPLYKYRWWLREYVAEFFGTFFLVTFGTGVIATTVFHAGNAASYQSNSSYMAITFGWGFGLTIGLFLSMAVSGGHLNPAVTLANCVFGAFPWIKLPGYFLAQFLGGLVGAANTYGLFKSHFDDAQKALLPNETMASKYSGIFATYPNVANTYAVWSEVFNTMALMMGILAITDPRMTPAVNYKPVAIGLLLFVIGITSGINSSYGLNPARDLSPRILSAMLWGSEPFTLYSYYFWIPLVAPFVGALLGMFLYVFFIIPPNF
ncbi:aquaporin / Aquaglyceroporin 1 (AQP1) [Leishmania donovani]|uniref:Aquaglyceroporin n=1 Tax=Leishmania donovani TaxID=5661 RepID=A5Z0G2_LEIDO|nr:aquaglyceroporin [Leishmania donovani]ABQ84980.1 aquaglyceroporin [Leishmania donovani]ABW69250.1 aquaglyceroporin [Leishmania donovani]TPP41626.1 MIP channel proteins family protein [Leishmania donovani]CAJ1991176.1 aquaporin / Aquaglyceroporin 1 (AQP1) [Leishmania donovani]CBZ36403.1 aquaglyceroporin [Leishmania donovani]